MISIQCNKTSFWLGSSDIKSPADYDPVLYKTACWLVLFAIKSPAYQDPVLYKSILARYAWYKVSCWSGSSVITLCWVSSFDIQSPANQDSVLDNSMLWSGSSVIEQHAVPVLLLWSRLLIKIQCYMTACCPGSSGIKYPADQDAVLYNSILWSGSSVI